MRTSWLNLRVSLILAAAWLGLTMLFAAQAFIGSHYDTRPLSWAQAVTFAFLAWTVRGAFAVPVFQVARRIPIEAGRAVRVVALYLAVSVIVAVIEQQFLTVVVQHMAWFGQLMVSPVEVPMNVFVCWIVFGSAQAARVWSRSHQQELLAARLRSQLSTMRLDALRAQLHPHFLFNTLHDIAELMHEDTERADQMLTSFSVLLRRLLREPARPDVPLRDELEFLTQYMEIARMRFGDKLEFSIRIDPVVQNALVPHLILQPLVENAIRHGVARRDGGRIEVVAGMTNNRLKIEVNDNGPGFAGRAPDEGIGLRTTRERLREQFGTDQLFELAEREDSGVSAILELPYCAEGSASIA